MMKNRNHIGRSFLWVCMALLNAGNCLAAEEGDKKPLKIVFLMGQSNMVGYAHPRTAWYLTQPLYVPPPKTATVKSERYNARILESTKSITLSQVFKRLVHG